MADPQPLDTAIRGSTTILDLIERFPDGRALKLMTRLGWPCGHCSARSTEPLSLAAKRHGNPVRAVIECFRMLEGGGPSETALDAARARPRRSPDPTRAWLRSAVHLQIMSRRPTTPGDGQAHPRASERGASPPVAMRAETQVPLTDRQSLMSPELRLRMSKYLRRIVP